MAGAASAFAFASPQARLAGNALKASINMQSFCHPRLLLLVLALARRVFFLKTESTFSKLFPLLCLDFHAVFISALPKLPCWCTCRVTSPRHRAYNVIRYQAFNYSTLRPVLASQL